jgi:hypothetical protein
VNLSRVRPFMAAVVLAAFLIPLIAGCGSNSSAGKTSVAPPSSTVKSNTNEEIPKGTVEKVELITFHRSTR